MMDAFKKIVSFLSVFILVLASIFASSRESTNTLHVVAQVPENYGVAFPDQALRFGDFVFEVKFNIETDFEIDSKDGKALIREDKLSVGEMKPGLDSFNFTLVYYGNLSKPYRTEILVDPNLVWIFEGEETVTVPIEIKLVRNDLCDSDIICVSSRDGQTYIEIPPAGPREGVPVLDVDVSWNGGRDLRPGTYTTELRLDMRVI